MRNDAVVCLFLSLSLLGFGLWMIHISLDPDQLASAEVSVNTREIETVEEKASVLRRAGFVVLGISAAPMLILVLVVKAETRRMTRIPLSLYSLLAGGGLGALAFQAFRDPSASQALVALLGLGSISLWVLSGVLLVPLLRAEEDGPTSAS